MLLVISSVPTVRTPFLSLNFILHRPKNLRCPLATNTLRRCCSCISVGCFAPQAVKVVVVVKGPVRDLPLLKVFFTCK